jgi:hypothetical protein
VRSGCLAQRASDGKGGSERSVAADRVRSNCGFRAAELVMCCDNIKKSALEELVAVGWLKHKLFLIVFKITAEISDKIKFTAMTNWLTEHTHTHTRTHTHTHTIPLSTKISLNYI